jgi:hypothetical protein
MAHEFELDGVVPWGREADEYEAFFALGDVPPAARVLDCGGGPASFTAEWRARGRRVTAADPLYRFDTAAIRARFAATQSSMRLGMERAHAHFVWEFYPSADAVVARRARALEGFAADRASHPGRYVAAALPVLPFRNGAFDLVLCSHFLFSCTPPSSRPTSTSRRCARCCAWAARCACSRSSISTARRRRTSSPPSPRSRAWRAPSACPCRSSSGAGRDTCCG